MCVRRERKEKKRYIVLSRCADSKEKLKSRIRHPKYFDPRPNKQQMHKKLKKMLRICKENR